MGALVDGLVLGVLGASPAAAPCTEPASHFGGGLWKQWILQITPGPTALAAVERIAEEVNMARAAAGSPLLVFDAEAPPGPTWATGSDSAPNTGAPRSPAGHASRAPTLI
jgi:hypothetical protein